MSVRGALEKEFQRLGVIRAAERAQAKQTALAERTLIDAAKVMRRAFNAMKAADESLRCSCTYEVGGKPCTHMRASYDATVAYDDAQTALYAAVDGLIKTEGD